MNTVSVQQKTLSTALLHYTGQKEQGNAEQHFVDENEINEALSENLFKNTKHDLYPHPHATF